MVAVSIIMGSESDLKTMQSCVEILKSLEIDYELEIVSAHRTPEKMFDYASKVADRGIKIIIAGAGGAAHLPGMVASLTMLPVIGVPIQSAILNGIDSLLSIVQMPGGVPVATMSIGMAGAKNAALLAAKILALHDARISTLLKNFTDAQKEMVSQQNKNIKQ